MGQSKLDQLIEGCIKSKLDPESITFITKQQVRLLNVSGDENVHPFSDEERIRLLKELRAALAQNVE